MKDIGSTTHPNFRAYTDLNDFPKSYPTEIDCWLWVEFLPDDVKLIDREDRADIRVRPIRPTHDAADVAFDDCACAQRVGVIPEGGKHLTHDVNITAPSQPT